MENVMRLPLLSPDEMSDEQRRLSDDMREGIATNFRGFKAVDEDGALIGPWNPWLHFPRSGGPIWELVKALSVNPILPRAVREVAILATGARFKAGYEIYAHELIAEQRGLSDAKIGTIVAGQRPSDLTSDEAIAYDVAAALLAGGPLPAVTYREAVRAFGEPGAGELINLVGLYCLVAVTLNGFDVPVPDDPALR
jgi:4-carboxymuconolactone decarboxylase